MCKIKTTLLTFLIFIMTGCSGCGSISQIVEKHESVTAKKIGEVCEPQEVYNVPPSRFPIPAQVARHADCMGIKDMLVIAWPGDDSETNLVAARLLMLMYVDHQNVRSFNKTKATLIKVDKIYPQEGLVVNMALYELTKITKEQKNENL